jgi:hypothetical protein
LHNRLHHAQEDLPDVQSKVPDKPSHQAVCVTTLLLSNYFTFSTVCAYPPHSLPSCVLVDACLAVSHSDLNDLVVHDCFLPGAAFASIHV